MGAVLVLIVLSPPDETEVGSLRDLSSEHPSQLACLVQRCRTTEKGYLLNLTDPQGNFADAFCPFAAAAAPPEDRSVVVICGRLSADDPNFVYVDRLELPEVPGSFDMARPSYHLRDHLVRCRG